MQCEDNFAVPEERARGQAGMEIRYIDCKVMTGW